MRKVLIVAMTLGVFTACNNSSDQGGVVNDGIKAVDSNGGLADTSYRINNNLKKTDTAKMENREDLSTRDTMKHQ